MPRARAMRASRSNETLAPSQPMRAPRSSAMRRAMAASVPMQVSAPTAARTRAIAEAWDGAANRRRSRDARAIPGAASRTAGATPVLTSTSAAAWRANESSTCAPPSEASSAPRAPHASHPRTSARSPPASSAAVHLQPRASPAFRASQPGTRCAPSRSNAALRSRTFANPARARAAATRPPSAMAPRTAPAALYAAELRA